MSEILQFLLIAVGAFIVLAILLILFNVSVKTILKFAVNTAVGIGVIFLLNLIPGVSIPIVWWTALVCGLFGIPGVLVLLLLGFIL